KLEKTISMNICGYVLKKNSTDQQLGIKGVAVSNGREVVLTNDDGYFELRERDPCFIMVTKPSGYQFQLNEKKRYDFFYLHNSQGTPKQENLLFKKISPTQPITEPLRFYLETSQGEDQFEMIMMGDIQPKSETDIGYFRDMVAKELALQNVSFYVVLGDLVWDRLELYPLLEDTLTAINIPYYTACGNHDINLRASSKKYATETYKACYGPTYYSFNVGKTHFVVLEDVGYSGWDDILEEKGEVYGWLDEVQLIWLENDLQYVPEDFLVVLLSHIPIYTATASNNDYRNILNRSDLFKIVANRKKLLAVSAHTHCIEHVDLQEAGWNGEFPFKALIAGAACGAWWKGPLDPNGLPVKMAMDGAPNGFFKFIFTGNEYKYDFVPIGFNQEHQMNIYFPSGELNQNAFEKETIVVNIFNASPEAKVEYSINNGEWMDLERSVQPDPYVNRFVEDHKESYPEWMRARVTAHLWKAKSKVQLKEGIHNVIVRAVEPDGRSFIGKKVFRILDEEIVKLNKPGSNTQRELISSS
ncbi:MAG: calcineurin-like phosphoesterase C-terminal domain-containing protein, partial [Bacteroidota bacterium]